MPYVKPNVTTYIDIMEYANEVTGGFFGVGSIFTMCVITFIATSHYPPQKSLMFAGWVGFIMSIMYYIMGLMDEKLMMIMIVIMSMPTLISIGKRYF